MKNNCDCPALTRAHTPTRTQHYVTILQTKLDPVSAGQRNLYQLLYKQFAHIQTWELWLNATEQRKSNTLLCATAMSVTQTGNMPVCCVNDSKVVSKVSFLPSKRGKQPYRWPKIYHIRILENEWNRALLFMVLTHTAPWQFLCLVARVWTQIASWKIHQPTLDLVYSNKKNKNARLHLLLQFLPASSTLWLFSSSNMLIVMKNLLVHSMSEAAAVWSLIMQQLGCWSDDLNKPCSRSSLDNFLLVSHWLILTHWDLDGLALERLHHGWFS